MTYTEQYKDCLSYIDFYWDRIISKPTREKVKHRIITIPYSFVTPNDAKFKHIFYWDSFFMFQGLRETRHEWIMKEMIENFAFLFERYAMIPNFNSPAAMGRSQPPFFSSMILDTYDSSIHASGLKKSLLSLLAPLFPKQIVNKKWLKQKIEIAKREYLSVWIDPDHFYNHSVKGEMLSRFGDRDVGYAHSSELESGWDFTSRFYNRCDDFLPVDLNTYLYKYEKDFNRTARILGERRTITFWENKMKERREEINRLMWNEKKGFYFDYAYEEKKQSAFYSLAGFVPMWAGIPTKEQAEKIVKLLPLFETDYGLTITDKDSLAPKTSLHAIPHRYRQAINAVITPKQWDYPNIWPPLEFLTVKGLLRYGFTDHAKRIMEKSLRAHANLYRTHKTFFEKINGATGEKSESYHYENQSGFGWTNAIFYQYIQLLDHLA